MCVWLPLFILMHLHPSVFTWDEWQQSIQLHGCNLNQTTRNASISKGCKYEILQDNENGSLKYLFVGCSQYKNVGWDVDQAVQMASVNDLGVHLHLINMEFPRASMYSSWYNGTHPLESITIENSDLSLIAEYAFDKDVFAEIKLLRFDSLCEFQMNWHPTHHHRVLYKVEFRNVDFYRISNHQFVPFKAYLRELHIDWVPDTINFTDLFGHDRFTYMQRFELIGVGANVTRSLDSTSLPTLPQIVYLALQRCGIERIQPTAFENVGNTLQVLDLSYNKLKSMSIEMFATIIDAPFRNGRNIVHLDNPLECTCELYELQNLMYFSLRVTLRNAIVCDQSHSALNCENVQRISTDRFHFTEHTEGNDHGGVSYELPKVNVRISNGAVIVKTMLAANFRLLVGVHLDANQKCPTIDRKTIRCWLLHGNGTTISIEKFAPRAELTTFAVILPMANKYVWPLHLQTYRHPIDDVNFGAKAMVLLIAAGIFVGLFTALTFISCIRRHEQPVDVEPKNTTHLKNSLERRNTGHPSYYISHIQSKKCVSRRQSNHYLEMSGNFYEELIYEDLSVYYLQIH